jgi:hypothetical protein
MSSSPLIYVDLIKTPEPDDYTGPRWQPYTLMVKSGDNGAALFKSTEAYTNRDDAIHAVAIAFGPASNVYFRESEQGNVAVRLANADHAGTHQTLDQE